MAGGKDSKKDQPSEAEMEAGMERERKARRDDLAEAIGLVLIPPFHGQDERGDYKFGLPPYGGFYDSATVERYITDMGQVVQSVVESGPINGGDSTIRGDEIQPYPYSVGPAAQEWPKYLFLIYEYGRPILEDSVLLYSAGQMVRSVVKRIRQRSGEIAKDETRSVDQSSQAAFPVEPELLLTPGSLVSLCITDLHDRYDPIGIVDVEIHTRSWSSYSTQGHPGLADDVHLVRVQLSGRSVFWSLQTNGRVRDHFQLVGGKLMQLPLPNWFEIDRQNDVDFETELKKYQLRWKGVLN